MWKGGVLAENRSFEEQLALRKAVDAAKQLLMERYGMAQGDAFEFLQEAVRTEQVRGGMSPVKW